MYIYEDLGTYYTSSVASLYSTFRLMSLIHAEYFNFENSAVMEDKQCKQMEQFSIMAKESDNFSLLYDERLSINGFRHA